jgi:hypothetical protein
MTPHSIGTVTTTSSQFIELVHYRAGRLLKLKLLFDYRYFHPECKGNVTVF